MNAKITIKYIAVLLVIIAFKLGRNGSFYTSADDEGGVGGFSLKKIAISRATTDPIIA